MLLEPLCFSKSYFSEGVNSLFSVGFSGFLDSFLTTLFPYITAKNVIPNSSVTVSDNMKLTWSLTETKFDWWTSFQAVLGVFRPLERAIQTLGAVWINAVQHSNHPEKMKMDDPAMKNIPWSKVTHHLTCSLELFHTIIHCIRLNANTVLYT